MEPPVPETERSLREQPRPLAQALIALAALLVVITAPVSLPVAVVAPVAAPQPDTWQRRAEAATRIAEARPGSVSYVVLDGSGREVAALNPENRVAAASTIKAIILAAYLRQPGVADRDLNPPEMAAMERMITASSNDDASSLLRKVGWDRMRELVKAAGITDGFVPDTESWGLTEVTARSLARIFYALPSLVPQRHRQFATELFGGIIPAQQWGMPAAVPDDWAWHMKAGWIDSVVNQVGAFNRGGEEMTLAITIEGEPGTGASIDLGADTSPAVETLTDVTAALFGGKGDLPAGTVGACPDSQQVARSEQQAVGWSGQPRCQAPAGVL